MAETSAPAKPEAAQERQAAEAQAAQAGGAYEVLRDRLGEQCLELRNRVDKLNARRREIFGGQETKLIGSPRIQTEHNCKPHDIIHLGNKLIVGFDVYLGMKKETEVSDILGVYEFDGQQFYPLGIDFLSDPKFQFDFKDLYKYYKEARLLQLRNTGTHLKFVFQTGRAHSDVKVLRFLIKQDKSVQYADNRGENVYPEQFDFKWTRTTRDDHVEGRYPHVSIADELFVECVGGDLTVKVEDNTDSGEGIYSEPVAEINQSLNDAEIYYVLLDNLVLLKIKPFGEEQYRYLVYSKLTQKVRRVDALRLACVQLPEGHGIIFPGGYFLQTGECKMFSDDVENMEFFKSIKSANGEDVLYLFHDRRTGRYILLQYNLINKTVDTPIVCHGYSLYSDGKLVILREAGQEPAKSHPVQIWQTAFIGEDYQAPMKDESFIGKIGNKDLVTGISDALTIVKLARETAPTVAAYADLVKQTDAVLNRYHWLGSGDCFNLEEVLKQIRETGNTIIDEFEKVLQIRKATGVRIDAFEREVDAHFREFLPESLQDVDQHAQALARIRHLRGTAISLRELRYSDLERLQGVEKRLVEAFDVLSERTVGFLRSPDALKPYAARLDETLARIEALKKVTDADALREELDGLGEGLDLLTEIVNNLKIDDATARTEIIEALGEIYAHLNRAKALLASRRKDLLGRELVAEFGAQFKLLGQGVANYLGLADTPEKCDDHLTKLLVQVEELEAKFSDFPEYVEKLTAKREEVYDAFSGRKQQLLDERQRKAAALAEAADRILKGVARRAAAFKSDDELNGYFAGDAMVMKVRDIIEKLRELGDSVKADDLFSRLKSARQDAGRSLRDKLEIFDEGDIIKLGKRRFNVNTQPLDLTLVRRDEAMCFHLTGTDYYQPVTDAEFLKTRPFWTQDLPSENEHVYRAEYLAWKMLDDAESGRSGLDIAKLEAAAAGKKLDALLDLVREYASGLYDEGYDRGVHDHDAALILRAALSLRAECGLLRFDPRNRALACLFWSHFADEGRRVLIERKARSLGSMKLVFLNGGGSRVFQHQLAMWMQTFCETHALPCEGADFVTAARYLFLELSDAKSTGFATSQEAAALLDAFLTHLDGTPARKSLESDLKALEGDLHNALDLAHTWLSSFYDASERKAAGRYLDEAIALLLTRQKLPRSTVVAKTGAEVSGLLGQHPILESGKLNLQLDEFLQRVGAFAANTAPAYRTYQEQRKLLLERERERLRLDEFRPRTLSSFVRNRLINDVYLPVLGDNLAKQMGEAGEQKRTDLMGLLLLISPPGYGKTTLMEYLANRLGLIFMKINGPALGHEVLSLDPNEAPNATAKEEVQKLNLAFEMGNNVMIYIDDIQHTHPEFLQKFISLCDAQRKVEGVYNGRARTYDLRGKKVCVVMAGNPYTESGARFQIPDMLANRAETYNLGDIIGGRRDLFELSYLENSMTSNSVLNPLATREQKDFYRLVEMADGGEVPESELSHDYSGAELKEILDTIKRLRVVQRVVLRVNEEYIRSASQKDEFRTEPPFKLQGSYRDMNKMASKVLPVMSEQELEGVIRDHYRGESQTLTTGAEHNLLKLAEIRGHLAGTELERWDEIKRTFRQHQSMMGADKDDQAAMVVSQLASFNTNLDRIKDVIAKAAQKNNGDLGPQLAEALARFGEGMQEAGDQRAAQMGEQVARAFEKVAQALAKRDRGEGDEAQVAAALDKVTQALGAQNAAQPKVEIVNTLPKYYGNLYKHHIDVIEAVLIPLIKSMDHQMAEVDNLHVTLEGVLGRLNELASRHTQLQGKVHHEHGEEEDDEHEPDVPPAPKPAPATRKSAPKNAPKLRDPFKREK
ncbi:MAG: DNA repair ATPase [Planctomycetes bacterium]|nr:DNA repair ATPase [Planctomycetota bacterium]